MTQQIIEGTWEQIATQSDRLAGKWVRVMVYENGDDTLRHPAYVCATPDERAQAFREWAESHSHETPILSDEAISRESIYSTEAD